MQELDLLAEIEKLLETYTKESVRAFLKEYTTKAYRVTQKSFTTFLKNTRLLVKTAINNKNSSLNLAVLYEEIVPQMDLKGDNLKINLLSVWFRKKFSENYSKEEILQKVKEANKDFNRLIKNDFTKDEIKEINEKYLKFQKEIYGWQQDNGNYITY